MAVKIVNGDEIKHCRKWSHSEDLRLIRQIKARPQNLHKCFLIVAEELGRTEGAVASHWYSKLSKDPTVLCFFTASQQHVSKNRKNSMGVPSSTSIWQKLIRIIRSL